MCQAQPAFTQQPGDTILQRGPAPPIGSAGQRERSSHWLIDPVWFGEKLKSINLRQAKTTFALELSGAAVRRSGKLSNFCKSGVDQTKCGYDTLLFSLLSSHQRTDKTSPSEHFPIVRNNILNSVLRLELWLGFIYWGQRAVDRVKTLFT